MLTASRQSSSSASPTSAVGQRRRRPISPTVGCSTKSIGRAADHGSCEHSGRDPCRVAPPPGATGLRPDAWVHASVLGPDRSLSTAYSVHPVGWGGLGEILERTVEPANAVGISRQL